MANSRDFTGKNRKFTGTKGIVTPKGTTGQRVGAESGELRFNTTTDLMEYYDGNQWKPIDAPPTISSISTSDAQGTDNILNADGSTLHTITISGGNFGVGLTVKFIGNTGTEYAAGNITRVSNSSITCKTTASMGTSDDPYDIVVTNASGLSAELADAFSFNAAPVFTVASGQLGTVYNGQVISGTTLNAGATDAEGNTITFTIISGSLPGSGLSISSSTGAITGTLGGTPSLGNYPFVVRASTTEGVVERQFSIQVTANPFMAATGGTVLTSGDFKTHVFTGPGSFVVTNAGTPAGADKVDYLVVAGGGGTGGGGCQTGGGGAGGFRVSNSYGIPAPTMSPLSNPTGITVTATTYPITVGSGGAPNPGPSFNQNPGNTSIFSTITSAGGGAGVFVGDSPLKNGGSGGGSQPGNSSGGSGNTPPVSPPQGNNGGNVTSPRDGPQYGSSGGGGAGGVGGNSSSSTVGDGGVGSFVSPTFFGPTAPSYGTPGPAPGVRYFAGGGGGGGESSLGTGGAGGGGTGSSNPGGEKTSGTANTGGGGGSGNDSGPEGTGGGSGIVVIRYKFQ